MQPDADITRALESQLSSKLVSLYPQATAAMWADLAAGTKEPGPTDVLVIYRDSVRARLQWWSGLVGAGSDTKAFSFGSWTTSFADKVVSMVARLHCSKLFSCGAAMYSVVLDGSDSRPISSWSSHGVYPPAYQHRHALKATHKFQTVCLAGSTALGSDFGNLLHHFEASPSRKAIAVSLSADIFVARAHRPSPLFPASAAADACKVGAGIADRMQHRRRTREAGGMLSPLSSPGSSPSSSGDVLDDGALQVAQGELHEAGLEGDVEAWVEDILRQGINRHLYPS